MKKVHLFFMAAFCFLIFGVTSCKQELKQNSIEQIQWLTGSWKGVYNGAPFYEAWRSVNDSLMINLSIEITGKDTFVKKDGFIRMQNGGMIHGSKNGVWLLTKLSDTEMVFESDTLKSPSRIVWSHSANDHWLAEIHNPGTVIYYDLERVPWLDNAINKFTDRN